MFNNWIFNAYLIAHPYIKNIVNKLYLKKCLCIKLYRTLLTRINMFFIFMGKTLSKLHCILYCILYSVTSIMPNVHQYCWNSYFHTVCLFKHYWLMLTKRFIITHSSKTNKCQEKYNMQIRTLSKNVHPSKKKLSSLN